MHLSPLRFQSPAQRTRPTTTPKAVSTPAAPPVKVSPLFAAGELTAGLVAPPVELPAGAVEPEPGAETTPLAPGVLELEAEVELPPPAWAAACDEQFNDIQKPESTISVHTWNSAKVLLAVGLTAKTIPI